MRSLTKVVIDFDFFPFQQTANKKIIKFWKNQQSLAEEKIHPLISPLIITFRFRHIHTYWMRKKEFRINLHLDHID